MVSVSIEGNDTVSANLAAYPEATTRATVRALNRAMASARTVMVREIARDMGLKAKDVREVMVLREAHAGRLEATLEASAKRIPLIDFKARGPEPSHGKGTGVRYRLPGGRNHAPHAFIATTRSGHRGVFQRRGLGRLPIVELAGPSLVRVFKKHRALGLARAQEAFVQNFGHELAFATGQSGSGGASSAVAD